MRKRSLIAAAAAAAVLGAGASPAGAAEAIDQTCTANVTWTVTSATTASATYSNPSCATASARYALGDLIPTLFAGPDPTGFAGAINFTYTPLVGGLTSTGVGLVTGGTGTWTARGEAVTAVALSEERGNVTTVWQGTIGGYIAEAVETHVLHSFSTTCSCWSGTVAWNWVRLRTT